MTEEHKQYRTNDIAAFIIIITFSFDCSTTCFPAQECLPHSHCDPNHSFFNSSSSSTCISSLPPTSSCQNMVLPSTILLTTSLVLPPSLLCRHLYLSHRCHFLLDLYRVDLAISVYVNPSCCETLNFCSHHMGCASNILPSSTTS